MCDRNAFTGQQCRLALQGEQKSSRPKPKNDGRAQRSIFQVSTNELQTFRFGHSSRDSTLAQAWILTQGKTLISAML